ncbi:MAG: hypothetical protein ACFFCO_12870, partial [Promethearchaeota archaeon]
YLEDRPLTHPDVQAAQAALMESTVVQTILGAQESEGHWGKRNHSYIKKYTATTHQLLILAELGAKLTPAIERGINHMFEFQLDSGHFTTKLPKTARGRASQASDMVCFDANILYYMIYFGYLDDSRVIQLVDFLLNHHSSTDGGWKCRAYPINPDTVFPENCFMGMCKALRAFSLIPKAQRTSQMSDVIRKVTEIILENKVYQYLRAPNGMRKPKIGWTRFGFPLFYNSDALEVLETLARLNVHDERMQDAINLVISKQQSDGKWLLKHTFNGRMWHDIEVKHQSSKWITLRALRVLRHYYSK